MLHFYANSCPLSVDAREVQPSAGAAPDSPGGGAGGAFGSGAGASPIAEAAARAAANTSTWITLANCCVTLNIQVLFSPSPSNLQIAFCKHSRGQICTVIDPSFI